jgi:hypothetical protein
MRPLLAAALLTLVYGCAAPTRLQVIENVLAHEGPPPPSPPLVRELLARPLAAMDADAIFARSVPAALVRLAQAAPSGGPVELRDAVNPLLDALLEARRSLPPAPDLPARLPTPAAQREVAASMDPGPFLDALTAFRRQNVVFPAGGARFERDGVVVVVGTTGDDVHELAPVRGAVRVLIDPGGNDRYAGSDMVLGGFAAIIDLAGDDRYESTGPAWGSAVAGASVLLDVSGSDRYEAPDFSLGAALAGLGAVVDLAGDDTYRVRAFGQGLGLAGGTGLAWDRAGNDRYLAAGLPDPFERGGALSFAQGTAVGVRTGQGGGIGILRDDAGDDSYEGQLYAQGSGYYYALGLLWDRGGDDRYRAARYAQGAGVHQAVGVLRDDAGDDAYELSVGVGQGLGLDLAVGALVDASGNDRYRAPTLAQGAATSNGVGIVRDGGGVDLWRLDHPPGRGHAEWSRGLPSIGLVLADAPLVAQPVAHEPEEDAACPAETDASPAEAPLEAALRALGPELVARQVDAARYALVMRELRERPAESLDALPLGDFDVLWPLGVTLGCALRGAGESQAERMLEAFERLLARPRLAGLLATALRARPGSSPARQRLVGHLLQHPSCGVRTAALELDGSAAAAQAALASSCWQLQAAALRVLEARGEAPRELSGVPDFLREPSARASPRAR